VLEILAHFLEIQGGHKIRGKDKVHHPTGKLDSSCGVATIEVPAFRWQQQNEADVEKRVTRHPGYSAEAELSILASPQVTSLKLLGKAVLNSPAQLACDVFLRDERKLVMTLPSKFGQGPLQVSL